MSRMANACSQCGLTRLERVGYKEGCPLNDPGACPFSDRPRIELNPFPLCTPERLAKFPTYLRPRTYFAQELETIAAAGELAELAKWLIAHGKENEKGEFQICIKLNNPHKLQPELLVLGAMRGEPALEVNRPAQGSPCRPSSYSRYLLAFFFAAIIIFLSVS